MYLGRSRLTVKVALGGLSILVALASAACGASGNSAPVPAPSSDLPSAPDASHSASASASSSASSSPSSVSSARPFQATAELPANYLHLGSTLQVLWVDEGGTTTFFSPDGVTTYGKLDREFNQIAVSTDETPVVYAFDSTTTAGGGIEKPTVKIDLVAHNLDGSQLWRTHLQSTAFDPDSCDVTDENCADKQHGGDIALTSDNKWLVIKIEFDRNFVVNTTTHEAQRRKREYTVEGNWLTFKETTADYDEVVRVVDPGSDKVRTTLTSSGSDDRPGSIELINAEQQQLLKDGNHLVAASRSGLWDLEISTGRAKRLWHDAKDNANVLHMRYDETSGNALMAIGYRGTGEVDQVDLFNTGEHKIRWTQPKATGICAIDDRTAAVTANHQTALLDAATGKQKAFSEDFGDCDPRSVNGPWYYGESVYRLLP